ncbi:MAG: hypothetical protein AAGI01_02560 [Myxococcota bacterium]
MERLKPEAIRGAWMKTAEHDDVQAARARMTFALYVFALDGSYQRFVFKDGHVREREQGTHTFDGEFLITRGRSTETYRVTVRSLWHFELESRRKEFSMRRALVEDLVGGVPKLADSHARDLRILPLRASFVRLTEEAEVFWARYDRSGELAEPLDLGLVSVERRPEVGRIWVGVTPLRAGLDAATWGRIAKDALVDLNLEDTDAMGTVVVRTTTDGQEQELER